MKARFIHVHREVNVGKLNSLTSLYGGYRTYLQACINGPESRTEVRYSLLDSNSSLKEE